MTTAKMQEFKDLSKIWNRQQKEIAKHSISSAERAKTTLTLRERAIKWVQNGTVIKYKNIRFYIDEEQGWGVLVKANGQKVLYASFGDFEQEVQKVYGLAPMWS